MKIVFGLGNPGAAYIHTRHNAGFDVLDETAVLFGVKLQKHCLRKYKYANVPGGLLVQPLTHVNASGNIMHFFHNKCSLKDIMVVCDNMDLAVGGIRIKFGGESGGQRGLLSIQNALGNGDFYRLFIGTGRPQPGVCVNDHVLSVENDSNKLKLYKQAVNDCAKAVKDFIEGVDFAKLQNLYNRKGLQ